MREQMLVWARQNILKWTVIVALFSFVFGPFIQSRATSFLENTFVSKQDIEILVCSPLRSATLLVSSTNGDEVINHSASSYPFLQQAQVFVVNNTPEPITSSRVFVAPVNSADNFLMSANFFSDNNVATDDYAVRELEDNSFNIELGTFVAGQVLVLEFTTLLPTAFVVEFSGDTRSKRQIVNAGYCDNRSVPITMGLTVDIFEKSDFPNPDGERLFGRVEMAGSPIGQTLFEVVLDYDCGTGLERQVVEMGGSVAYCNMRINMPPESASE